jgi:hypothetical protein
MLFARQVMLQAPWLTPVHFNVQAPSDSTSQVLTLVQSTVLFGPTRTAQWPVSWQS